MIIVVISVIIIIAAADAAAAVNIKIIMIGSGRMEGGGGGLRVSFKTWPNFERNYDNNNKQLWNPLQLVPLPLPLNDERPMDGFRLILHLESIRRRRRLLQSNGS